jgi:GTP:adenosylcobinamide-phosphate guanylyltransferase
VEGVIPEDFGYCVMLAGKPLTLWIACGNRGERMDEWIAFVVAGCVLLKRALGVIDPAKEIGRVSEVLAEIMRSAPGVEEYFVER